MKAVVIKKVNQRLEANTSSQKLLPFEVGDIINVIGIEEGELYRGSNRWLLKDDGTKTWARAYNINYGSSYIKQFDIESLWDISTGKGIKVGVIDNEINTAHISLTGCPITKHKTNPINSIHATYMAAIIGARNVKEGFLGVAPGCELHAASYPDENEIKPHEVLDALQSLRDAHIINLSFATNDRAFRLNKEEGKNINQIINEYVASGKILLAATGNNSAQSLSSFVYYPSFYKGTISIAGGYNIDGKYFFEEQSNVWNGIDLIGPVQNFYDLIPRSAEIFDHRTKGNSITTAFVSGILALVYDKLKAKGALRKNEILDLISIPVSATSTGAKFTIETRWLSEAKIKQLINL